mgnify:FL=1
MSEGRCRPCRITLETGCCSYAAGVDPFALETPLMRHLKADTHAPHSRVRADCPRGLAGRAALLAIVGLGVAALPAMAQINLYDSDAAAIDVRLDAATVTFAQNNPWFGEPEANIGVDTSTWAEFAIEPQLYLTLKNVFGGELSAGLSAVGTKTYGESAEGFAAGISDPGKATLEKPYVDWKTELGEEDFFEVIGGDFASELLAGELEVDLFIMATDADAVYVDWGQPPQRRIVEAEPDALDAYDFPAGSMGPKVRAACAFARHSGAKAAIEAIVAGTAGTLIINSVRGLSAESV